MDIDTIKARRYCKRCEKMTLAFLVRNITTSGISQVYWLCARGNHPIGKPATDYIPHDKIRKSGYDPDILPIIKDYLGKLCEVCKTPGVENHHWAPIHIFEGDAWNWPQSYLCRSHHSLWHKLVTPGMSDGHL